jgi:hypothetical protein
MEGIKRKNINWKGQGSVKNAAQKHKKFRGDV